MSAPKPPFEAVNRAICYYLLRFLLRALITKKDIHSPKAYFLLRLCLKRNDYDIVMGDLMEAYAADIEEFGEQKAKWLLRKSILSYITATIYEKTLKTFKDVVGIFNILG